MSQLFAIIVAAPNKGERRMNRIKELVELITDAERFRISLMLNNAAEYVRTVVAMEVVAARVADFDDEEFRLERESTDRARSRAHDSFISSVNTVNSICDAHGVPRIYTGGEARRAYGDFALELVSEIFSNRT